MYTKSVPVLTETATDKHYNNGITIGAPFAVSLNGDLYGPFSTYEQASAMLGSMLLKLLNIKPKNGGKYLAYKKHKERANRQHT